jgi:uncharacterized protein YbaP (TraB family)
LDGRILIRLLAFLALLIAAPALAAPGMWVVRDADTEITLFGTVHALPKDDPWFGPAIKARLDAADTLVLETIIPADKAALASMVMAMGTRAVPKPLTARVSKQAAPELALAVQRAGLALPTFDRMDTWLAATVLGEASLAQIGVTADSGVEPALEARARAAGKPVIGLEAIEQQLGYFDAMPEADQVAMLEATLDDLGTAKADTELLIALWRTGDIEAIARDFAKEAKASPLLMKVLLTDRNARWADWIAGVMKRPGKVFIAVGAAHLGGPEGVVALLAKKGLVAEKAE